MTTYSTAQPVVSTFVRTREGVFRIIPLDEALQKFIAYDIYAISVSVSSSGKVTFNTHQLSMGFATGSKTGKTIYGLLVQGWPCGAPEDLSTKHFPYYQKREEEIRQEAAEYIKPSVEELIATVSNKLPPVAELNKKNENDLIGFTAYDQIGDDTTVGVMFLNRLKSLYELNENMAQTDFISIFKSVMEDEFSELTLPSKN